MTNTIRGFFFDLDGTLVNTHEANFRAYKEAIREVLGIETVPNLKKLITEGYSSEDFLPKLFEKISTEEIKAVQQKKKEVYPDHLHTSELNDFLSTFLEQMSKHHTTALVTTAKRKNAQAVLEAHGIEQFFDFFVFGDDVAAMKPDPEAYNLALERTGLRADEVIAFEDSARGTQAAHAAGIKTILIRNFL